MDDLPLRRVARVVLLDAELSVLLVRYEDTHPKPRSWWVSPGGALEPGESHRDAARREIREETGLDVAILDELWTRRFRLQLPAQLVNQVERYFFARVEMTAPAVRNSTPENIQELRWWSLSQVLDAQVTIYPEGFARELPNVVRVAANRRDEGL